MTEPSEDFRATDQKKFKGPIEKVTGVNLNDFLIKGTGDQQLIIEIPKLKETMNLTNLTNMCHWNN